MCRCRTVYVVVNQNYLSQIDLVFLDWDWIFVILEDTVFADVKQTIPLLLRCGFGGGMEHPVHRGEAMPTGLHDR